jgi:transposase
VIEVGIDWAEDHHDVVVLDEEGRLLASRRIPEGVEGLARLHAVLAEQVEDPAQVLVGVETDRGLLVGALVAAGYQVYAVNPRAVDRYRDRHGQAGAKSDAGDARVLADLVRTDRHQHRRVAGDSELAEAIKILARSHQNLIWARQRLANQLRSTLREFYPAALAAFAELASPDALAVLAAAPTPARGQSLTVADLMGMLGRAGRRRELQMRAEAIHQALQAEQLAAPALLADAFGASVAAIVGVLTSLSAQIDSLHATLSKHFEQHPDAEILRSLPGLGIVLGARVLGEFGDDPNRYADAKARKNYAGTAPITRASGKRLTVLARFVRNRRLADPLVWWAFCSLTCSPGARACYDRHRARGATHQQALRTLANRWVGILHGCLRHRVCYDELTAWPAPQQRAA